MSSKSSKTEAVRNLPETVEVARIRRPHGVRGAVLVEVESDVASRFQAGARLLLRGPDGSVRPVTLTAASPHRGGLLLNFEELADRDAVEVLRGYSLEVPVDDVPARPENGWYFFELLGCRCVDRLAGELGEVVEILEDGGGVLLRVEGPGRGLLVPFARAFVSGVNVDDGTIALDLPESFLATCAYRS
jgi:16S rRNA processing protein RimM